MSGRSAALAIARLGAVLIDDSEWAYRDDATGGWYVAEESDLEDLGRRIERGEPDAYSRWCADTHAERLSPAEVRRLLLGE